MKPRSTEHEPAAYAVPPVARAFKVLRHIAAGDELRNVASSARSLGISRTTLIRLVATLAAERMIERTSDGAGYRLGLGLAGLAAQALFSADIVQISEPILGELADRLGLSAHLGVLEGREVLYVSRRTPNLHLVSNVRIGSRLPAHATTLGRIILAHKPVEDVQRLFAGARLKAATEKTPTTVAALLRQLETDRMAGLAWSASHFEAGISSVAAPIFDHAGCIVGAINVTGPTRSFEAGAKRTAIIDAAIRAAARRISHHLGFVAITASSRSMRRVASESTHCVALSCVRPGLLPPGISTSIIGG
jgi:DNA-binding IclR family transcriptional regulator